MSFWNMWEIQRLGVKFPFNVLKKRRRRKKNSGLKFIMFNNFCIEASLAGLTPSPGDVMVSI